MVEKEAKEDRVVCTQCLHVLRSEAEERRTVDRKYISNILFLCRAKGGKGKCMSIFNLILLMLKNQFRGFPSGPLIAHEFSMGLNQLPS